MFLTSPKMEEKLWSRLTVIAVEDVGLGNPQAPMLIETLYQQHHRYARLLGDRFLFAAHAIRVLATSPKERVSDDLVNWAKHATAMGEARPEIIDAARDMHTASGQAMGRDYRFFMEEASRFSPVSNTNDPTWRDWITAALDAGKMT